MELQEVFTPAAIGGIFGALVHALLGAVRGAWTLRREGKEEPYRQRLDVDLTVSRIVETENGQILEAVIRLTNVGNVALRIRAARFEVAPRLLTGPRTEELAFSQDLQHDEAPDVYSFDETDEIPGLELLPNESTSLYRGISLNEGLPMPLSLKAVISSVGPVLATRRTAGGREPALSFTPKR